MNDLDDPRPADDTRTKTDGLVAPGFGPVADAFRSAVDRSPRGGAALSVRVDGVPVVDLCGGGANGESWHQDTPTVLFSCSKGLLALLIARLVEAGRLDIDVPVADLWPEFAAAGKEAVTVRQVLSHQAGLAHPVQDLTREDVLAWDPVVSALAAQEPLWTPGTRWSYHALTFGWLVGEIVRRVTDLTVGHAFDEWVAGPCGSDVWFGVPAERAAGVPDIAPVVGFSAEMIAAVPGGAAIARSLTLGQAFPFTLVGAGTGFNDPAIRAAEVPGAGAIGTAAALAAVWSSAIVPTPTTRPLAADLVADLTAPRTTGEPVFGLPGAPNPVWGSGFMVHSPGRPLLTPASFGHDGAGGQLGFADPDTGVGFGFLTSDMDVSDGRALDILTALRRVL